MPIYATGKKKNGRTQYRVRVHYTEAGEHLQKEQLCYGYREAVEMEERLRAQYSDGSKEDMLLRDFFQEYTGPAVTSEQIAEQVGLSRITVRRYAGYMAEHGELNSFVDYQTGGRPCIRYTAGKK